MIETSRSKVFIGIQLLLGTAGVFGSTMQERSLQDSGIGSQALDTYQPRTIVTGEVRCAWFGILKAARKLNFSLFVPSGCDRP